MQFGLIGYPLSHSFSKGYFGEKFAKLGLAETHRYDNYPLASIAEFPALLAQQPELRGLNVTIPYKQQVIPFLDELSAGAQAVGAVNTILFTEGRRIGYNTDVIGFQDSLSAFVAENGGPIQSAWVLGTGGAAKAVVWVLEQLGAQVKLISRSSRDGVLSYDELTEDHVAEVDLIVNTTPLGMSPNIDTCPNIPYHCLSPQHRLYDLVYNPEETLFLRQGKQRGAATTNGYAMLLGQAEAAWEIWTATTK